MIARLERLKCNIGFGSAVMDDFCISVNDCTACPLDGLCRVANEKIIDNAIKRLKFKRLMEGKCLRS